MPKANPNPTTTSPSPAAASAQPCPDFTGEQFARRLAPSCETDRLWNIRDPASKMLRTVDGAADRLAAIAKVCRLLAFYENYGHDTDEEVHPHSFIATSVGDIAKGLREIHRQYWDEFHRRGKSVAPKGRRRVSPKSE